MLEPVRDNCRRGEVDQRCNQRRAAPEFTHLDEGCVPATFGTMMVITRQNKEEGGPLLSCKVLRSGGLGEREERNGQGVTPACVRPRFVAGSKNVSPATSVITGRLYCPGGTTDHASELGVRGDRKVEISQSRPRGTGRRKRPD